MSEAARILIERCAHTCMQRLALADLAEKSGHHAIAAKHRAVAETASELALFLAVARG